MKCCTSLLCLAFRHLSGAPLRQKPRTPKRRKSARRSWREGNATTRVCDSLGMTIPEARLRRDKLSPDAFDRCIAERARGIIACETEDTPPDVNYGAFFDLREMRFQGRNSDICKFAEMAVRAESTKRWNDTLLQNSVAFVRDGNCHQNGEPPDDNSDEMKKSPKKKNNAVLHRALNRHGNASSMLIDRVEKCSTILAAKTTPEISSERAGTSATNETQGKQRVDRRRRRIERVLNREGDVHPCVHQGGCASKGGVTLCPFVLYPATVCVKLLRHGCCEDAISGCCPWWHGSVTDTSKAELLGGSLFQTKDKEEESDDSFLQDSCEWMAMLLQMFLDVVVAALEGMQFEDNEMSFTEMIIKRVQMILSGGKEVTTFTHTDLPVHFDAVRGVLSVEQSLAVSTVMADMDSALALGEEEEMTAAGGGHERGDDSFDALFARELASLQRGAAQREGKGKGWRDTGEWRLRRVLTHFRGYLIACDEHGALSARITLCAPLTRWLLLQAAENCVGRDDQATEVAPRKLFEGACTVMLRERYRMCSIDRTRTNDAAAPFHRWAALLLLQEITLLARISASRTALCDAGHNSEGCSLLYKMLLEMYIESEPGWSRERVQAQYVGFWVFLQSLLSTISLCILRDSAHLFALARPAMVDVARQLARDIEEHFTTPLLRASGWSAWTDEQMFASQQAVAYTAADYTRFHMRTIAHSFMVSMLNVFLLHTLRVATYQHQLRRSPVGAVLFSAGSSAGGGIESPQEILAREQTLRGGAKVRRGVRFYALEALALFSLLQEEGNAVLTQRQLLMDEFMTRKKKNRERYANEVTRRRSSNNGTSQLSEKDDVHILEKLLPHGSAMVSADAVALLLRVLLEGGGLYKALRLATSAIHACRTLRHAAGQPKPYVVQSEKTIHKRVRHPGSKRKHVIRTRVPFLRRVDPEEDAKKRSWAGARPIGVYLQLSEMVVEEVTRLGLRSKSIGMKLARGVCNDCMRGSLIDYSAARCLPAPSVDDLHDDGTVAVVFGTRALQVILSLAGVGNRKSQLSRSTDEVIIERQVPPTAMLLEIAVALTPSDDREAHSFYERFYSMDQRALINDRVVLAQQYHAARRNFSRAINNTAVIWIDAVFSLSASHSRALAVELQAETDRLPPPAAPNETRELTFLRAQVSRATPPRTLTELRYHLEHSDESVSGISSTSSHPRPVQECHMLQCFSSHASDLNTLRRMSWAAIGGVLLAVDEEKLTGTQRSWSRLLLRNTFIIAQQFGGVQDRSRYMHATVRLLLLLSGHFEFTEPLSASENHSPWFSPVVRGLPQYLAAQIHLAEQLNALQITHTNVDALTECKAYLLPLFKTVAGLQDIDLKNTPAWHLIEPFLSHPQIAKEWLQTSFYTLHDELLTWVIARTDTRDPHNALALAAWIMLQQHNNRHNTHFLDIAHHKANKHCTPEQQQQLQKLKQRVIETP